MRAQTFAMVCLSFLMAGSAFGQDYSGDSRPPTRLSWESMILEFSSPVRIAVDQVGACAPTLKWGVLKSAWLRCCVKRVEGNSTIKEVLILSGKFKVASSTFDTNRGRTTVMAATLIAEDEQGFKIAYECEKSPNGFGPGLTIADMLRRAKRIGLKIQNPVTVPVTAGRVEHGGADGG